MPSDTSNELQHMQVVKYCSLIVVVFVLTSVLLAGASYAQDSTLDTQQVNARRITLEDCLAIAHRQSPALLEAKSNYNAAVANAESSERSLRSKVDLTLSAPIYTDETTPLYNPTTGLTDLYQENQSTYGGGIVITQPIYWTGGTITFDGSLVHRNQFSDGSSTQDYLGIGSFRLDQPLFKSNEFKLTERESDIALDLAHAEYVTQWATLNYTVRSLFYALFRAEQELTIQRDEVAGARANYTLANNKYKAGLIAEVDALQLEVDLASAETDLYDRERQLLIAQRDLSRALGLPLDQPIAADDHSSAFDRSVGTDSMRVTDVTIDTHKAIEEALARREDILSARYAIDKGEISKARISDTRTINASLVGTFGATRDAEEVALLSRNPYLNRGLSLLITVPLFDWGAQSLRLQAADEVQEAATISLSDKQQQIEQEVRSTIEEIQASKKQVAVAKKSVAVAKKAYDLSLARFDAGKITSQDLTLAQDRLTRARLSSLNAQVAELLSIADLSQKTLYDFENDRPIEPN